ncbi:MAG: hypothetical protein M3R49_08185 [Chloroflexota bacterium]|nr:hypothetical protein [Chloroflexota bacterium]
MDPKIVLPFLASLLSFVFAALVFDQWVRRRHAYQLVWTLGLLFYGIGAGVDFLASAFGWNQALYRTWYLFGAFGVAAYLGLGTIFLLNRTRFGYFVAFLLAFGGLISLAFSAARAKEGIPTPGWGIALTVGASLAAAVAVAAATRLERRRVAPLCVAILGAASLVVVVLTLTASVEAPGYAVTASTGAPNGDAFPAYLRMLTPPFNITGGLALVFGAIYSAYIFMPKRRVLRPAGTKPLVGPLLRGGAVVVNFVASLPGAWRAYRAGRLNSRVPATILIALGGFVPSLTSGLTRLGISWAYFLGELLGVVLIFVGFLVSIEVFSDLRLPFTRVVLRRRDRGEATEPAEAG